MCSTRPTGSSGVTNMPEYFEKLEVKDAKAAFIKTLTQNGLDRPTACSSGNVTGRG